MKPTKVLTYATIVVIIIILAFNINPGKQEAMSGDTSEYIEKIKQHRHEQDSFMRNAEESPFVEQNKAYNGLNYFEPDPTFKVNAEVEKLTNGKIIPMPTSNGETKYYLEFALLHFDLLKSHHELKLYQSTGEDKHFFLPFYDETSAITTYGSGRYVEIEYPENAQKITIDFNMAYNPYCAYTEGYSCPIPPRENYITVAIKAGEKNYD